VSEFGTWSGDIGVQPPELSKTLKVLVHKESVSSGIEAIY
jgi:hypothetical protein